MIQETLRYSDYIEVKRTASLIDPGTTITKEVGFKCPHCKALLLLLNQGGKVTCRECGLRITRYGNDLDCNLKD